jgi:CO/xanthine dehydrogenase Mo-binding subunit
MTASAKASFRVVGKSVSKVDALGMACGLEAYVGDHDLTGALVGHVVPSPHAHARIRRIDATRARAVAGVHAVLTHRDLPRIVHTTAGQGHVEPSPYDSFVLDDKVRFVGDKVALIAAETREAALEAARQLEVDYEVLPAVLDPARADEPGAPVIHDEPEAHVGIPVAYEPERNVAARVSMGAGDLEAVLRDSHLSLSHDYGTHYAQHCPLEPHVCLGWLDARNRVVLVSSTQVPFHARRITALALGLPVKRVRVIKPRIGGGFGAKQEVMLEQLVAALVLATRRKVLLTLTREEEFLSRTRHPIAVGIDGGFDAEGRVTGMRMRVRSNTGAYGAHALTVMSNCGSKVLPLYRMQAVGFEGVAVYTNLPVGGAYRGYGATQSAFAMESFMDEAALALGVDPLELRRRNHIRPGEGSPVFAALGEGKPGVEQKVGSSGLAECLERGARAIGWSEKRGRPGTGPRRRGVGMAALMQGSSIPEIDMAAVSLKMNDDGSFNLHAGATDLGTGSDTVLAQIAAEVLGVEVDDIIVTSSDTDVTPFDVGAYASSTTYLSGEAARRAAVDIAEQVKQVAADMLELPAAGLVLRDHQVFDPAGRSVSLAEVALRALYERDQRQIASIASAISHASPPPFSAHFAEVEVDVETGFIKVLRYVAAVDCGTAVNPRLAEGQVEGAVLNGISYALTERYLFDERGKLRNAGFADYKLFNTLDLPKLETILVPTYEETGPYGAKSVSEICINGPCPAIANAVFDAVGIRLRETPFTAERVLAALEAKGR